MSNESKKKCYNCKHVDPNIRMDSVGSGYCRYYCEYHRRSVSYSDNCDNYESRWK